MDQDHDLAHALASTWFALSDLRRGVEDLRSRGVPVPAQITQAVADFREWLESVSG